MTAGGRSRATNDAPALPRPALSARRPFAAPFSCRLCSPLPTAFVPCPQPVRLAPEAEDGATSSDVSDRDSAGLSASTHPQPPFETGHYAEANALLHELYLERVRRSEMRH